MLLSLVQFHLYLMQQRLVIGLLALSTLKKEKSDRKQIHSAIRGESESKNEKTTWRWSHSAKLDKY